MNPLSALERAAAEAISRQLPEATEVLVQQLATAAVTLREFTPTGFYTEFEVSRTTPAASTAVGSFGWVRSFVGQDLYAMEFILYVRDGYARMIEGYSYGDGYGDLNLLSAAFTEPEDLEKLQL